MGIHYKNGFKCPYWGNVDNADVNAAFNISKDINKYYQSDKDRDLA